jgi:hypothetical protein
MPSGLRDGAHPRNRIEDRDRLRCGKMALQNGLSDRSGARFYESRS